MDTEALFTATKWEILKLLEQRPHSPVELAEHLGTGLANVSQQLRLLEMAGLVASSRVSNRDKGKPRVLYRLAGNLSYLIATSESFVDKKVVQLSERNKVVLRIWFLEDPALRYSLEKAFWELEPHLDKLAKITFAGVEEGRPVLEAQGAASIPGEIRVGGQHGAVSVRTVAEPVGYVLYTRE